VDSNLNLAALEKVIDTHQEGYVLILSNRVYFANPAAHLLLSRISTDISKIQYETLKNHNQYILRSMPLEVGQLKGELVHIRDRNIRSPMDKIKKFFGDYDLLSGLINRKTLERLLRAAIKRANRIESKVALLQIDILDLHTSEEYLDIIEKYIEHFSKICETALRETDSLAHLAESSFAVLLEDLRVVSDASSVAEKLLKKIYDPQNWPKKTPPKVKIGVVVFPDGGLTASELLNNAQIACESAQSGRYSYFLPTVGEYDRNLMAMDMNLRNALAKKEFSLVYQPVMSLVSSKVVALEALLRWNNPILGQVSPSLFIPRLEISGAIKNVGMWVINEACRQFRNANLGPDIYLSVNVSPIQLMQTDFPTQYFEALKSNQLQTSEVILEITESTSTHQNKIVAQNLNILHKKGVRLAVDDFGTGYASLRSLIDTTFSIMKLDQSYIDKVHQNQDEATFVKCLISLAKALNLRIIAEGVNTADQPMLLKEYGCDAIQGTLVSEPIDILEVYSFIQSFKPTFS
tara:strand:+ start:459 stop:2018 length:1560 start_codon:yes stop_codon:yes gene_type:complete